MNTTTPLRYRKSTELRALASSTDNVALKRNVQKELERRRQWAIARSQQERRSCNVTAQAATNYVNDMVERRATINADYVEDLEPHQERTPFLDPALLRAGQLKEMR